jgi:thiol-disulfide isomerase/thioredoxin
VVGFVMRYRRKGLEIMDENQRVVQISDVLFMVVPESCSRGVHQACDDCGYSIVEFKRVRHARKSLFEIGYASCSRTNEQPKPAGKEERQPAANRRVAEDRRKFGGPYDKESERRSGKDRRYGSARPPVIRCYNCLTLNRVPQDKLLHNPVCGNCKTVLEFPLQPLWARNDSFDRTIAYWPETLLVVFTTPLCINSKIVDPVLSELAREKTAKLKIMKVDIESEQYLGQRFKIDRTPTFIIFKNGAEIIRVDGAPKDKNDLVKWIDNLLDHNYY